MKSSCKKTSGWSASDLSGSGTYVVRQMKGKLSGGTGGISNGSSSSGTVSSGTSSKAKSVKASKKYCTVSVKKDGSWKKSKRYYTLYRVTIRNKSKYNISGWKLRSNSVIPSKRATSGTAAFLLKGTMSRSVRSHGTKNSVRKEKIRASDLS